MKRLRVRTRCPCDLRLKMDRMRDSRMGSLDDRVQKGVRTMNRSRVLLTMLAVILALVPVSSGALAGSSSVLRVAVETNPPTLDPHITTNAISREIAAHVFETLLTYDEDYQVIPQLALKYEASKDHRVYTFYLRSNVKFHNGKTMSAVDVKASLERIRGVSPSRADFAVISDIEVVDPLTLRITLREPCGAFPYVLANPVTFNAVMPAEIASKDVKEIPVDLLVGTGPFMIDEWVSDVKLVLKRFDDYAVDKRFQGSGIGGERRVYFDKVEMIPVLETGTRVAGLETGTYDVVEGVPMPAYDRLKGNTSIQLGTRFVSGVIFEINHKDPLTSNVKVRQAILAALNAEEILAAVTNGHREFYRVQPSFFIPEQKAWHMRNGEEFYNQNNPEHARALLKEAGYGGEPVVIICSRDYDYQYRAGLALEAQLKRAGMNVKVEVMDWPSQMAKAKSLKDWNINCSGWTLRPDPIGLNGSLMSGSSYAYGYNNPDMEHLLMAGIRAGTLEERQQIYKQVQELLYTDVPVIRVGDLFAPAGWQKSVFGVKPWYIMRYWNVMRK